MDPNFEIYYDDLTPEAQKRFLKFQDIEDPCEGNYDIFPIVVIER